MVVGLAQRLQESKFLLFIVVVKSSQKLEAASYGLDLFFFKFSIVEFKVKAEVPSLVLLGGGFFLGGLYPCLFVSPNFYVNNLVG